MAVVIIGAVGVSIGVIKPLLSKIATLVEKGFVKPKKLRKEVDYISKELTCMKDALEKLSCLAELDTQDKRWRDDVRDMPYDIEDIIDDFMRHIGEKGETNGFAKKTAHLLKKLRGRYV